MSNSKLFLLLFCLLIVLSFRFLLFYQNQPQYHNGQQISFETTLLSEPKSSGKYQQFTAALDNGQKIYISTSRYPEYHYGDTLKISGKIKVSDLKANKSNMQVKNSNQLNRLINNKKTIISIFSPKIEAVKSGLAVISYIRQKTVSLAEKSLPPVSSTLLLGIVFGIKGDMPKEFVDNLRISGVMHVIAASGMNVTMIGSFLSGIFAVFLKRQLAFAATIFGIVFYALMAGLEPSIVRASIMGILVFSAQIIGRQTLAIYSLLIAAFLMLFKSPNIISDIGFQLSFLSTLGLLYVKPLFYSSRTKQLIKKSIIGEDITTTISAQIATMPVMLANFGTYSLWSVVVNGLVLWMIPFLMILGGAGTITGMAIEPVGRIFLYLTLPFLLYFQKIVSLFAEFGGAINTSEISWQLVAGYYLIFAGIIIYLHNRRQQV